MAEEDEDWKVQGASQRFRGFPFETWAIKIPDDTPECGQKGRANAANAPVPADCYQRLLGWLSACDSIKITLLAVFGKIG